MVVIPAKTTAAFGRSASGLSGKSTPVRVAPSSTACPKNPPPGQRVRPIGAGVGLTPRAPAATPTAASRHAPVATVTRTPLKARQIQQPTTTNGAVASKLHAEKKPTSASLAQPIKKGPPIRSAANSQPAAKAPPSAVRRRSLEVGLRRQLAWSAKASDVLSIVSTWQMQDAERKHVRQLEQLRADFAKELSEKCEKMSARLEKSEQSRTELVERLVQGQDAQAALERRFADERAALTLRAEEAESSLEAALLAKQELESAMAKDDNEKIQKLSNDISGLNYVIQQKTDEVRKLRADNFQLQSEVDSLRQAKIEVQKLQNRLDESREQLKRQQNIQKDLVQQLERCREEAQNSIALSKITEQENEVLKYKMRHLNEFTPHTVNGMYDEDDERASSPYSSSKSLHCTTPISSRTVNNGALRTPERHNSGGTRPNSTSMVGSLPSGCRTPPRSNGSGMMHKSLDAAGMSALSVYQSQGRSGRAVKNTPSKIYAPEGTFEVPDQELSERDEQTSNEHEYVKADNTPSNDSDPIQNGAFIDFDAAAENVS